MNAHLCLSVSICGLIGLLLVGSARAQDALVPGDVVVSAAVRAAVDDELLSDSERRALLIFHGLFEEIEDAGDHAAELALAKWDLLNPLLDAEADAPAMIRAEAALRRGDLHRVEKILQGEDSPAALLLQGRADEGMGRFDRAVETLTPLREAARRDIDSAADMTAAAEAIAELAVLQGRPAQDYHTILQMLSTAQQQLDRLYWPALIGQARLLVEKDNPQEAVAALHEALTLSPGASEAWYLLGCVALGAFDFDSTQQAVRRLRRIHPEHVLADVLEVEMYLTQKDPVSAEAVIAPALLRYPHHRHLLATAAAVAALKYDEAGTGAALEQFDAVSPQHPLALFVTGKYLSMGRQYEAGEQMLRAAIGRQPNWTEPRIELGLMLNQAGKDAAALEILRAVVDLDPFNKRAINTLKLQEELAGYSVVESDHFIIRYRDEIDGVLAADMPAVLEEIYADITAVFAHQPQRKTIIDILPDKRWFAVRITGMPWIWTIGAATGPVIAITPPREGRHHSGPFDWAAVIRHEFVHTVTLSQTSNRIAHWFTEALAVSQEPGPRDYQTSQLLAAALADDELFDLEGINWAFVRPRRPQDRALAYAQSHWMAEYITHRYGHRTILKMLDLSSTGMPQAQVVPEATGERAEDFLAEFKQWAQRQVQSWGLAPTPPAAEVLKELAETDQADLDAKFDELLEMHPDHPDLLRIASERALERGDDADSMAALLRYATVRPIDPWAGARIAEVALRLGQIEVAIAQLEELDRFDQQNGAHAQRLTDLYRRTGQLDHAQSASERALHRQPYNATLRETAAAIAIQRGDHARAEHHLLALPRIEPDRAVHATRLAAFYHRLGRHEEARAAASRAHELDPRQPVERFLNR